MTPEQRSAVTRMLNLLQVDIAEVELAVPDTIVGMLKRKASEEAQTPKEADPFDESWTPDKFAAAISGTGAAKKLAMEPREPVSDVPDKFEEPVSQAPDECEAEAEVVATPTKVAPIERATPVKKQKVVVGQELVQVAAGQELVHPLLGKLHCSLGLKRTELTATSPAGARVFLCSCTDAQTPFHREFVVELVRWLLTEPSADCDAIKMVFKAKLEILKAS
jgi:hypothetical protein